MSRRKPDSSANKRPLLLPSQQARAADARGAHRKQATAAEQQGATARAQQQTDHHTVADAGTHSLCAPAPISKGQPANAQRADAPVDLPLGQGVRLIAWHPCGLYVLDKPEGVLSHPNKKAEIDRSLLTAPYSLEGEFFYNLHAWRKPPSASAKRIEQASAKTQANADEAAPDTVEAQSGLPCPPAADTEPTDTECADAEPADTETTDAEPANTDAGPAGHSATAKTLQKLYLLHRLDSATSGLLLLADNAALADSIRTAFAQGGVRKTYLALCAASAGIRAGQKGRWSDRLQREHQGAGGNVVHVRTSGSGVSAVTDFLCRATAPRNHAFALLELHPISGRTHQLRVHCAQHQLPILGDAKYGDFRLNRAVAKETGHKRLFLHATALALDFVHGGNRLRLQFTSPQPPQFDALLRDAPDIRCATPADARNRTPCDSGSGKRNQNGTRNYQRTGKRTSSRNPSAPGAKRQGRKR